MSAKTYKELMELQRSKQQRYQMYKGKGRKGQHDYQRGQRKR